MLEVIDQIYVWAGSRQYNPVIPASLSFPGKRFCSKNTKLLTIGSIPLNVRKVPAIIIATENGENEGIHINLNLKKQVIERYTLLNGTKSEIGGTPGDGTSIDFEEPFVLNLSCDDDGWILEINNDPVYLTVLHTVPLESLTLIKVTGDIIINFIGIGDKGKVTGDIIIDFIGIGDKGKNPPTYTFRKFNNDKSYRGYYNQFYWDRR